MSYGYSLRQVGGVTPVAGGGMVPRYAFRVYGTTHYLDEVIDRADDTTSRCDTRHRSLSAAQLCATSRISRAIRERRTNP